MSNLDKTNADFVIEYYKNLIIPFPRNIKSKHQCNDLIKEIDSVIKQLNQVKSGLQSVLKTIEQKIEKKE